MRQIKPIYPENNSRADLIRELIARTDFEKEVESIRHKWKIDVSIEIHLWETNMESIRQNELLDNKKFIADLRKLQKKFKLGQQWSCFIEEYIFLDFFVYQKTSNFFIEKRTGKEADSITRAPAYYIRIFPETTQEDITKSWGEINRFIHGSKIKNQRQKLSKKFERDQEIYKLAKLKFSVLDIQKYIEKKYHNRLEFNTIIRAESLYRKRMGIKEKNKLSINSKVPLTDLQKIAGNFPDFS